MKKIALLFLLFWNTNLSFSQNIILIDREFNWTSYLSDTVNDKIALEYFPIYKSELDSLIIKIEPLLKLTKMGLNKIYLNENDYSFGHLRFKMQNVEGAYGDRYNISLISKIGSKEYLIHLNTAESSLSVNRQKIRSFLSYMKKIQNQISKNKLKIFVQ